MLISGLQRTSAAAASGSLQVPSRWATSILGSDTLRIRRISPPSDGPFTSRERVPLTTLQPREREKASPALRLWEMNLRKTYTAGPKIRAAAAAAHHFHMVRFLFRIVLSYKPTENPISPDFAPS
jgi:hypothetical protein